MFGYILKKLGYSLLVLWGVITLVFFIFNLGSDPVENLVAENSTQEIKDAIRKKFDLDLSFGKRYALYLNNLSPISIHDESNAESRIYFDSNKYSGLKLFPLTSNRSAYLKKPYLGVSYLTERNVDKSISEALPGTILLAVTAIFIALILGLFIGVYCANNKGSVSDHLITFFSVIGMSGPSFFMAILVAWIGGWLWYETIPVATFPFVMAVLFGLLAFFYKRKTKKEVSIGIYIILGLTLGFLFKWLFGQPGSWLSASINLPGTGLSMNGSWYEVDVWEGRYVNLQNLILPAITLGIRPLAVIVQLTRSAMLAVMSQDFIRTARAKGLPNWRITIVHGLRNALNPVITAVSGWFASLLAGAVFVEFVFGYKGLGMLTYNALEKDDMPIVMGSVLVIAVTFGVINFLVDIAYGILDPRIRVK